MTIGITAYGSPVTVAYKVRGKLYNTGSQEAGTANNPFDQVTVAAGTTFTVDGEVVFVRELDNAAPASSDPAQAA